jgi:predicted nucleic acid-binding protein
VEGSNFGVTAQIVQEFFVNVVRKADFGFTVDMALEWIESLEKVPCHATDMTLVKNAIAAALRWRISYWDAAVLVAAEGLGARILYTEDLNHGQAYGAVTAIDPFREPKQEAGFHEPPARPLEGAP